MAQTTSGNVAPITFDVQRIIEHGMRRAGFSPERISGEGMLVARNLLYSLTSELCNAGMPLWTQEFGLLGIQIGSPDVPTPVGTLEILHCYWRILNPYRGPDTLSGGGGDLLLFGGQPNTDVVVPGPSNPYVLVNFTSQTEVDTIGVLLGGSASITTALAVYGSNDGINYSLVQTLPSATYVPMQWTYFDLDPSISFQYVRLQYNNNNAGNWILNQLNFGLANGQDIEAGPLSIDDYYNLPNKLFRDDRSVSAYQVRGLNTPSLKLWPTPSTGAFYNGTISALMRRYIEDPGAFNDVLEVPQRWLEAIIWRLASRLVDEIIPDMMTGTNNSNPYASISAQQQLQARITRCETMAARSEQLAWGEERNRGPIRIFPNIGVYTK